MGFWSPDAFILSRQVPTAIKSLDQVISGYPENSIIFFLGEDHYIQARIRDGKIKQEPDCNNYPGSMEQFIKTHSEDPCCIGLVPIGDTPEQVLSSKYSMSLNGMEVKTMVRRVSYIAYK